jgi:hypothetical protein
MDVRFTRCNPTASIATDCACSVPQVNAGRALRTTMHSACKIHYRQLSQIAIGNIYQQQGLCVLHHGNTEQGEGGVCVPTVEA